MDKKGLIPANTNPLSCQSLENPFRRLSYLQGLSQFLVSGFKFSEFFPVQQPKPAGDWGRDLIC